MPFRSRRQEEACFAQEERDKKEGKKPEWNCEEWEHPKKKKSKSTSSFFDYKNADIKSKMEEADLYINKASVYIELS